MNLCGLSCVCFPEVRINERSRTSAEEGRRKEEDAEKERPGGSAESHNEIIRIRVSIFITHNENGYGAGSE